MNGLNAPATGETMPPVNAGANPPPQPSSIESELDGSASGVSGALHGIKSDVVVNTPHDCGVANGALGPPFNRSTSSSNGTCGLSANVAVNCPDTGSTSTRPASFTTTPDTGSSAWINNRTIRPLAASPAEHGPHSGEPKNTLPGIG